MACAGFAPTLALAQVLPLADVTESFVQNLSVKGLFAAGDTGDVSAFSFQPVDHSITGFDSSNGVLIGVSGLLTLRNQAGTFLRIYSPEKPQALTGDLSTVWRLGSQASGSLTFASVSQAGDAFYTHTGAWNAVSFNVGSSDAFVAGSTSVPATSNLSTAITVTRQGITDPKDAKGQFQGYLSATSDPKTSKEALNASVDVKLTYNYLQHSTSTFLVDQGGSSLGDTPAIDFDVGLKNSTSFRIGNVGDASTSSLFFLGASCIGSDAACNAYKFSTESSFSSLAAGASVAGLFTFDAVKSGGSTDATVTLTFRDAMGAEASRRNTTLAINVYGVAAVPEPHGAAMLLAGLGAIGWMSRRRRSARDQVAKL
jgi:hypothetical protein